MIPLILFALVMVICSNPGPAVGQILGTKYLWIDSVAVSTTRVDSTFERRWEEISFWFIGCNGLVKIAGAADTTDFTNRKWLYVYEYQVVNVGPADRLKRMWYKAETGTGALVMTGYKTHPQY